MHVLLWFLMYMKVNAHLVKGLVLVGFIFKVGLRREMLAQDIHVVIVVNIKL